MRSGWLLASLFLSGCDGVVSNDLGVRNEGQAESHLTPKPPSATTKPMVDVNRSESLSELLSRADVKIYRVEPLPHTSYNDRERQITDLDSGDVLTMPRGASHNGRGGTWGLIVPGKRGAGGWLNVWTGFAPDKRPTVFEITSVRSWDLPPEQGSLAREEFDATRIARLLMSMGKAQFPNLTFIVVDSRVEKASSMNRRSH